MEIVKNMESLVEKNTHTESKLNETMEAAIAEPEQELAKQIEPVDLPAEPTDIDKIYPVGCYAIIVNSETGEPKEIFAKSKAAMAKKLEDCMQNNKYVVLGVFKGKKLLIDTKAELRIKLN